MLQLTVTVNDSQWPLVIITITRESQGGRVAAQEKIQYDLAYDKAELMCHNALRPMVEEVIRRRRGVPQGK